MTQALGRIDEVPVKVGGVQCTMTFMVVDTNSYDVLLGLDFLIKIGAIVDVEQGLIQVRHGPGTNVEVLPLTMVNMLQRMNFETMMRDVVVALENTHLDGIQRWLWGIHLCVIPLWTDKWMRWCQIQTLIRKMIVMEGLNWLSQMMMGLNLGIRNLKILYCQRDHNKFCN